jgi:hypothetical protein
MYALYALPPPPLLHITTTVSILIARQYRSSDQAPQMYKKPPIPPKNTSLPSHLNPGFRANTHCLPTHHSKATMRFLAPTALLPILAALARSAAVPMPEEGLSVKDIVSFTTCKDPGLTGACITWNVPSQNTCSASPPNHIVSYNCSPHKLTRSVVAVKLDGSEWSDTISSVSVPNGYRCRLWRYTCPILSHHSTPYHTFPAIYRIEKLHMLMYAGCA